MALIRSPYSPSTPQSYNAHNTVVNKVIDGINNHSHDINQGGDTSSAGAPIPQFGSADSRYTTVGPGSSAWSSLNTLTNKSAIPADPGETAIDPLTGSIMTTGTGSSYSSISYGHGIGVELARIRGQLAKLTGQKWYTSVGSVISFSAGGSGRDLSVGTLTSTSIVVNPPTNAVAPFSITFGGTGAPPMVTNLNAQFTNGYSAITTPATALSIPVTNAQGLLSQSWTSADTGELATFTTTSSLTTTNTIQDNLNSIRYVLQQWARTTLGASAKWNDPANITIPLVTSISALGANISGTIQFVSGLGIQVSQSGPSSIRFDSTSTAPFTDAPVLNYPDMLKDTALSGSIAPSTTALQITINGGLIGYVNGTRIQLAYPIGPLTVIANSTNYVYWNGGTQVTSFTVNQTGTSPGAGWVLMGTGTLTATATNANQTTPSGTWSVVTNAPVLNQKPIITGSKTSGAALVSLLSQLSSMGFIVDQTTA